MINCTILYQIWTENNNGMVSSEVFGMDQADKYVQEKGMEVYWNKDVSQNYGELVTAEEPENLGWKMKNPGGENEAGSAV